MFKGGFKGKRSGGFGEKRSFGKKSFGDKMHAMHSAICSTCKQECEVPFKPNGKKPIFCSACFKKDDRAEYRPSFSEKRSFKSDDRGDAHGMSEVMRELRAMNQKLEAILQALTGDDVE